MAWGTRIDQVADAIDTLSSVDVAALPAHEQSAYVRELNRQLRRLDCTRHQATAAFERSGALRDVGFRTLAQWHRDQLHCSTAEAGRIGALARSLVHLPTVTALWETGELGADQARAVAAVRTPRTEAAFDQAEADLAVLAAGLEHHELRTKLREWLLRADPDGPDPSEPERDAHVSRTFEGNVRTDANLDPVGGTTFKDVFDEIVDEFFREDWAEARERLGRDPEVSELARTSRERRHDAMVEIGVRARAFGNTGCGRAKPLVTVVSGLDALAEGLAQLWDGVPLSPHQLAGILHQDPTIQRFLYGSDQQPIAHNPRARLYTGKLREAILTRDRHCTGRGCLSDTRRGAVDHIHPASEGGRTTPHNGRGTCHPCNRARPNRRFRGDPDPP